MNAIKYAVVEAGASLWRGRRSGALSIITISAALFVLGALMLVTWNLEQLLDQWSAAAELSVYLEDDASAEERASIEQRLAASELVSDREYVSKADALVRFRRDFTDLAAVTDELEANPFPASFEVTLEPDVQPVAGIRRLADELQAAPGVSDVRYDRRWIERVAGAVNLIRGIGLVIVGILVIAASLTVGNVVRLACFARRDELEIMRLVGAPMFYVRAPFVVEGVLQGGVGALVALGILGLSYSAGWSDTARRRPTCSVSMACGSCQLDTHSCCCAAAWWSAAWAGCWPRERPASRHHSATNAAHGLGATLGLRGAVAVVLPRV